MLLLLCGLWWFAVVEAAIVEAAVAVWDHMVEGLALFGAVDVVGAVGSLKVFH